MKGFGALDAFGTALSTLGGVFGGATFGLVDHPTGEQVLPLGGEFGLAG